MKSLTPLRITILLSLMTMFVIALLLSYYRSMPVNEVKPLIVGKWLHNPGACIGKLPREGFFDISIFTQNPDKVVLNKIVLNDGRITELNKEQLAVQKENAANLFNHCEKIKRPSGTPTIFYYKHPLKEFLITYYPKDDLLIQTVKDETIIFQRFSSVDFKSLEIVDSL